MSLLSVSAGDFSVQMSNGSTSTLYRFTSSWGLVVPGTFSSYLRMMSPCLWGCSCPAHCTWCLQYLSVFLSVCRRLSCLSVCMSLFLSLPVFPPVCLSFCLLICQIFKYFISKRNISFCSVNFLKNKIWMFWRVPWSSKNENKTKLNIFSRELKYFHTAYFHDKQKTKKIWTILKKSLIQKHFGLLQASLVLKQN